MIFSDHVQGSVMIYSNTMLFRKLFLLFLFLLTSPSWAEESHVYALAMHGAPKYPKGFTHFDYTNEDAPKGGTLRLGAVGTFDSLNPFIIHGQAAQGLGLGTLALVYESLMARSWDEPFSLYGLIAQSVEVPDDRSSITFNLRPEARWQDGLPITADDVMFSFATLREQGRPNHRTYYKKVEKAEKLDQRRVKFTFKRNESGAIDREMPLIMGLMPVLPKHDWQDRPFNATTLRVPVGSGPYKIATVNQGRSITYVRDENYWGRTVPAQRGLYNFSTIRIDYFRDDGVALQAFLAGQLDLRREPDPNKWATAYDIPAVEDGRIARKRFALGAPEAMIGFIFNTRRPMLQNAALREALSYAFDSGWINRTLFHGLYRRTESFFPNTELAATETPEGKKFVPPSTDGSEESLRQNLRKASEILKTAGYVLLGDQLCAPDGSPVTFEILLSDPAEEKLALTWARALKRIGVVARTRTVDRAQYQARLTSFDYDVTVGKWFNSLSPGNEQAFFWGSPAAAQKGSRNYAGIRDPEIDKLASAITAATSREDLVTATRALDRTLLKGHYVVPFYHLGADPVAYWATRLDHPKVTPLYGTILESWWGRDTRE